MLAGAVRLGSRQTRCVSTTETTGQSCGTASPSSFLTVGSPVGSGSCVPGGAAAAVHPPELWGRGACCGEQGRGGEGVEIGEMPAGSGREALVAVGSD